MFVAYDVGWNAKLPIEVPIAMGTKSEKNDRILLTKYMRSKAIASNG